MSFKFKHYQDDCDKALSDYLKSAAVVGAAQAFNAIEAIKVKYRAVPGWEKSNQLPYVCLRVPTGGGKTLIAARAVGTTARDFLRTETPVVLWLAPSNPIVEQTLKVLRTPGHPCRQTIEKDFGPTITVMTIKEALYITRGALDGGVTVIVSTMQALRREDTEGVKVYETAGALQHHFTGSFADHQRALAAAGVADVGVYSLAHVLRTRRPIVIMDEAHNARTANTFDFLQRLDPSAIVEFTATPDQDKSPSNILYSVTAAQLKAEDMIKLPIRLVARPQWKEALQAAIAKRDELEEAAKKERAATGEYIRPIVLLQAQPKAAHGVPLTVDVLRKGLIDDFNIPAAEIARATGEDGPLPDDILTEGCKIKYVLTVQKLREGWDCPFAYVLCSVSHLSSHTAVEQTLGRILRMPRATLKNHPDLNHAYAFVTSEDFEESAKNLTDTLVEEMGFSKFEAKQAVEKQEELPFDTGGPGLWAKSFTENVTEAPKLETLPPALVEKVTFDPKAQTLTYTGAAMPPEEEKAIAAAFTTPEAKTAVKRLALRSWGQAVYPAALGQKLAVPLLCLKRGEQLELFEDQHHNAPWKLADKDAALPPEEWSPSAGMSRVGVVDVSDKGDMTYTPGQVKYIDELRGQMMLHETKSPKTAAQLAAWLDRATYDRWVTPGDKIQFVTRVVRHLLEDRKVAMADVLASRFTLAQQVSALMERHRKDAARQGYAMLLLPEALTPLVVDPKIAFTFPLNQYPAPSLYEGAIQYQRHYYKVPADMNGDEAKCAAEIDKHPKVRYWVRNLTRDDVSFWLQTATDKFYPDFVALLDDGRVAVVEFKAHKDASNDDSREKKAIGETWAARSEGKCLFAMVTERDCAATIAELLG